MKNALRLLVIIFLATNLTNCTRIFIPKKQKVTFVTKNKEAEVYLDNELLGTGSSFTQKIDKSGVRQVVVRIPGYKDAYYALVPQKRHGAYIPLAILDAATLYGAYAFILPNLKSRQYSKSNRYSESIENPLKKDDEKEIDLIATKLDIIDVEKDIVSYRISYSKDLEGSINKAEADKLVLDAKLEAKLAKQNKKYLDTEKKEIKYDDTYFSVDIYKTLKESGYVDTLNKALKDKLNVMGLEASIKNAAFYNFYSKGYYSNYFFKIKIDIDWLIKNSYGEITDSIRTSESSGEFVIKSYYTRDNEVEKAIGDAINISFLNLFDNDSFTASLKRVQASKIKEELLSLAQLTSPVIKVADALKASVIIKNKDNKGHGSGFAVSQDGYIITNYHVISGDRAGQYKDFVVVLPSGEEVEAEVVRVNQAKDVALLKVDKTFEKAFQLKSDKSFELLQNIYCVGTPKAIDLGQTVSIGLLSNERVSEGINMLQLSMSVNSGNSGGPLFGEDGALHGIVTSKLMGIGTEGISFAVPTYMVADYLNLKVD
jgi:hypothetical protein